MRTQQEILDKIKSIEHERWDFFGVAYENLCLALTHDNVKPYLKEGIEEWSMPYKTDEDVINAMREYFSFANEKVDNERGLSTMRSIHHYRAWLFLIGDEEGLAFLADNDNYEPYGKPMLDWIGEKYGF